jgi:hypothetical protein
MGPEKFIEDFGAPFFPTKFKCVDEDVVIPGAALRDVFAMHALSGILAGTYTNEHGTHAPDLIATAAYSYADAMLRARCG